MFQSTYLYKVRHFDLLLLHFVVEFQSTYLYKVRHVQMVGPMIVIGFNPRTYIRYDTSGMQTLSAKKFQSTYLYKVRQTVPVQLQSEFEVSIHVPI